MKVQDQFIALQKWLLEESKNSNLHDGASIEIACEVNKELQTITPGIHIMASEFDSPLFISIGELQGAIEIASQQVESMLATEE